MTDTDELRIELDDNVLDRLAHLICGDDSTPYYRRGFEIEKFFQAAGCGDAGAVDGYRKQWVLERLRESQHDSTRIRAILLRLADPREYLDEPEIREAVLVDLNDLLGVEGYQVTYTGARPRLVEQEPVLVRPAMRAPVELTASLGDLVSDQDFGHQLRSRLDEAYTCWESGAPTAAIIMLGSLLEGVLYDVMVSRRDEHDRKPTDHLETLINFAQEKEWIAPDVKEYAHVLRGHRNLVHPKKQLTHGYGPEDDTVRIAWNVVVATINDLADPAR